MNNKSTHFHDGLFEDLRKGVLYEAGNSVLCSYFREEKRSHEKVKEKKQAYEKAVVYGPPTAPVKEKKTQTTTHIDRKSTRRPASQQPAVEILCQYYDFLTEYETLYRQNRPKDAFERGSSFLADMQFLTDTAKAAKYRKKAVRTQIEDLQRRGRYQYHELEQLIEEVMDLYLYAEAAQFLYNAGYPLPKESAKERKAGETEEIHLMKLENPRIKTIPLRLLDLYFSRKDLPFETLSAINRTTPLQVSRSMDMTEEIEEVYRFVCENKMKGAVIPLLIDNDTGSGLYIIGETYLKSWNKNKRMLRKVQKILSGRSCCYAIVKFLNIEAGLRKKDDPYVWSPYSIVDMINESGNINPESILFSDLDRALNIYQRQLTVKAQDILYENFHIANWLDTKGRSEVIPDGYRKYFGISEPEDLRKELEDIRTEYEKRLKEAGISK